MSILFETFQSVGDSVRQGARLTEYAAQQAMLERFRRSGLITFSPPIVAVNQNSGNPHYEPSETLRRRSAAMTCSWLTFGEVGQSRVGLCGLHLGGLSG